MPIYYDPSEARKSTRLPKNVINAGKKLKNLELLTGADLLVTPYTETFKLSAKMDNDISALACSIQRGKKIKEISKETSLSLPKVISAKKLWVASQMGILVQRKSGMDFVSSIPKLDEIFGRMKLWTPDPWLLLSANIGCDRNGYAVVDGRKTKFLYKSIIGKKMSWNFNGGSLIEVTRDKLIGITLDYANRKLEEFLKEKTKFVVRRKWTRQNIIGPNDERWQWMQVLVDLPGIGDKKAKAIAEYCGSLSRSFEFLTDPDFKKFAEYPKIVRPSDVKKNRELMGLDEDFMMGVVPIEKAKNKEGKKGDN